MDVNDFVHINCVYFPRACESRSHSVIVHVLVGVLVSSAPLSKPPAGVLMLPTPIMLENPSTIPSARPPLTRLSFDRANFDYMEYLNERSPLRDFGFVDPLNPYGSNINHGEGGSSTSEEHLYTPCQEHSSPSQLSPQLTPLQPLSRRGKVPLLSQEANLVSHPEVASSTLQEMDLNTKLTSPCRHTNDVEDIQIPPVVDEIALVEPSPNKDLMNCSNISSCDLQRHLLGESTNGDSIENDKGVNQGVAFPTTTNPQQPLPQPTLDARPAPDAPSLTAAAFVSALVVEEFYNASEKALHPDTIIPKVESGWWKNHKM